MGQQWRFEQDDTGRWRWVHVDGENEMVSSRTFADQIRCMMDAMRYVVRRRRPDSKCDRCGEASQAH